MRRPIEGLLTISRNQQFNRAAEHKIGRVLKSVFAALIMTVVLAACAGDSQPAEVPAAQAPAAEPSPTSGPPPSPTSEPTLVPPTPTAEPTETPMPEGPQGLALVEKATVQIVAQGTFSDPSGQAVTVAGAGSGFLISEDGLVVTNNHVVTGAATLNVFVPDRREPVNARVVAASECADLAIIQLPGDGYPFLEFHEGPLAIGTQIFAGGYPLGEPEYALVAGIISKLEADGESSWASVEHVIQHDAAISPGNSGGPLVTEEGRVVGIVYASLLAFNQFFGIGLDQALAVLEILKTGESVDWIGINGEAYLGQGRSGVWAASVESGSPADQAGILPGGIIVELERLTLGDDGTLRDYCDVLRTRGGGRAMQVKVVRFDTGEILEGQINGRPLVVTGTLGGASAEADQPAADDPATPDVEYITVTDDTGRISVSVPANWELNTAPLFDTPSLETAPDLAAWDTNFTSDPLVASAPGIALSTIDSEDGSEVTDEELLIHMEFNPGYQNCFFDHQDPYSDPLYTGYLAVFSCTNGATLEILGATENGNPVYIASVISFALTPDDTEAVQAVYSSFVMYTQAELDGDVIAPGDEPESEYVQATDNTGQIVANVRPDWGTDGTSMEAAPMLNAAPDIDAWMDLVYGPGPSADTSGIMLMVLFGQPGETFGDPDLDRILTSALLPEGCPQSGRFFYADPLYGGMVLEAECGGETKFTILAVTELESPTYIVVIRSLTQSAAERGDVQEFYDTFIVYPDDAADGVEPPDSGESSSGPDVPGGVVGVLDDTGIIFAELPQPWLVATASADGFPIIDAAPNLDAWYASIAGNPGRHVPPYPGLSATDKTTAEVAGIFVTVLPIQGLELEASDLFAFLDSGPTPSNCSYIERPFFESDTMSGQFDKSICDHGGTYWMFALLHLDYPNQLIWIEAVTVSGDDELALIHFLATLTITP